MVAVFDHCDVKIHNIAGLERFLTRHPMTNLLIDRRADRLGIRRMAVRRVIERRGNGLLHVYNVIVAQLVQLIGGDPWNDKRTNVIKHLRGQTASDAHFFNFFGSVQNNRHRPDDFQNLVTKHQRLGINN